MRMNKMIKILMGTVFCLCCITKYVFAQTQDSLTYENDAMGIKIAGPEGWFITPGEKVEKAVSKAAGDLTTLESIKEGIKKLGFLIIFSKYPFGSPVEFNPTIALVTEQVPREYPTASKTAIGMGNANILTIKAMYKDAKIIKEPATVRINNKEGAHLIWEGTSVRGYLETRLECSVYIFIKDNIIYTLSFTDKAGDLDNNVNAFESSIKTFVLK